jgi:nicotinamide mononucleotide transporter
MEAALHAFQFALWQTSNTEWLAIFTSLCYVILAAYQKRLCWYFAFSSSILYIFIGFNAKLYPDMVLNAFYAAMAIYGWLQWKAKQEEHKGLTTRNSIWHIRMILIIALCGIGLGFGLDQFTDQAFPYLDALAFFASIIATWMITKKIVENWFYFVVIDACMAYVYFFRGYFLTSILFLVYTVIAWRAFINWRKQLRMQDRTDHIQ